MKTRPIAPNPFGPSPQRPEDILNPMNPTRGRKAAITAGVGVVILVALIMGTVRVGERERGGSL